MFNLRFHIVSLVAVFVALGVGIFIGSALVGSEGPFHQQQELINQLEEDFHRLRSTNQELTAELRERENKLAREKEFNEVALSLLSRDLLSGKKVQVMIYLSSQKPAVESNALRAVEDVLLNTGAEIEFFTNLEEVESSPITVLYLGKEPPKEERERIFMLEEVSEKFAAVTTNNGAFNFLAACKKAGISTVDNIDTAPGRLALLAILMGQNGNFGTGATSEAFLPDMAEVF